MKILAVYIGRLVVDQVDEYRWTTPGASQGQRRSNPFGTGPNRRRTWNTARVPTICIPHVYYPKTFQFLYFFFFFPIPSLLFTLRLAFNLNKRRLFCSIGRIYLETIEAARAWILYYLHLLILLVFFFPPFLFAVISHCLRNSLAFSFQSIRRQIDANRLCWRPAEAEGVVLTDVKSRALIRLAAWQNITEVDEYYVIDGTAFATCPILPFESM